MKKNSSTWLADLWLTLQPLLQTGAIVALFIICFLVPIVIALNAPVLQWWWVVLLVLYLSLLISVYWIVLNRRKDLDLRGIMGDKTFYEAYPRAKMWDDYFERLGKLFGKK